MTVRVQFVVDGDPEELSLTGVPVPAVGTRIQFDGREFEVRRSVVVYTSIDGSDSVVVVHLSECSVG